MPARPAAVGAALVLLWSVVALGQGASQPAASQPAGRPRAAVLLGNEALPPMCFLEEGRCCGVVVDLAKAVARRMARPTEVRLADWAEAQRLVRSGAADALLQINPSPERLALYDFSAPLLLSEFMIFTGAERLGVAGLDDLKGLRVGVERKGLPAELLRAHPEIVATPVADVAQGLALLTRGQVEAVIADRWVGTYLLARDRVRGVRMVPEPVARSESAIAVRKGEAGLLAEINAALADLRGGGEYEAILDRWRPKEVVFLTRQQQQVQAWITAAETALVVAALACVGLLVREGRRRCRAQAALRQSENSHRMLVGVLPTAVYTCDAEGRITFFNERAAELWGRRPTLGDSDQRFCGALGLWLPDGRPLPHAQTPMALAIREGTSFRSQEVILEQPGGRRVHVLVNIDPLRDADGRIIGAVNAFADITERRQAERDARAAEELAGQRLAELEDLYRNAPVGLCVLDRDLRFLRINDRLAEINGIPAAEHIGKTVRELLPQLAQSVEPGLRQVLETGQPKLDIEIVGQTPAQPGVERSWLEQWLPLKDARGRVTGLSIVVEETTARKRAEQALRESEQRLRRLYGAMNEGLALHEMVCDGEGRAVDYRVLDVNPAFERITGIARDRAAGALATELYGAGPPYLEVYARVASTGRSETFETDFAPMRKSFHISVFSPAPGQFATVFADITARKRAEQALQESEERLRLLGDNLPESALYVYVHELDGRPRFLYVSAGIERMNGVSVEEVLRDAGTLHRQSPPDVIARLVDAEQRSQRDLSDFDMELPMRRPDGEVRWMRLHSRPMRLGDGRTLWNGVQIDITARRRAEQALREAMEELRRSNEELQQFAYISSHDLQEPLRMVSGFMTRLRERYADRLDDKAREYIGYAVEGAQRMSLLINDLLEYSRAGAKGKPLAPVDAAACARQALHNCAASIQEAGATVEVDGLGVVMGDEVQLTQLFQNLIGNAVKFRGPQPPVVRVSAGPEGEGWLRFCVRDNGIGIAPGQSARLFQVFQRLHTRQQYGGTGIGLAICKKIVERHGGRIWIESAPGEGASFYFTMPQARITQA